MPFKVYCHGCRAVLHVGENMKAPYEIIEDFEGKCPNCHRKLSHTPKNVEVIPIE